MHKITGLSGSGMAGIHYDQSSCPYRYRDSRPTVSILMQEGLQIRWFEAWDFFGGEHLHIKMVCQQARLKWATVLQLQIFAQLDGHILTPALKPSSEHSDQCLLFVSFSGQERSLCMHN